MKASRQLGLGGHAAFSDRVYQAARGASAKLQCSGWDRGGVEEREVNFSVPQRSTLCVPR